LITAGTYEGRSPDALGVAGSTFVTSDIGDGDRVPWPSEGQVAAATVPLLFLGEGIRTGEVGPTVGLDQIAPTLEPLLGLSRPHPEVRSGEAIPDVVTSGRTTPLLVVIVWKSLGTPDIEDADTPWLDRTANPSGSTTGPGIAAGLATPGSLPLDPTAVETTIGTGGVPSEHGITGTWVRNEGRLTRAFGSGTPPPVIATLGDDLDRASEGRALIGLIRSTAGDAGLTGDAWYGTGPIRDTTEHIRNDVPAQVTDFLDRGWGDDATPDLLAVPLSGGASGDDRATLRIVDDVLTAVPDATIVVKATGSLAAPDAIEASAPPGADLPSRGVAGGFFVDRAAGSTTTAQDVVDGMRAQTAPDGVPLYTDAFANYAVRFGRYC
jgi:hypothetical protein